jgi:hypothetical protein
MNSLPHGKISQGTSTPSGQICPGTGEIATIKTDQGRLHATVNNVQSKQLERVSTSAPDS